MATSSTLPRGGMSACPFANEPRLDRLDFSSMISTNTSPEKAICLQTITDAVHNYKFFGLGRNGTTIEEFAFSCEYLFHVRSWEKNTWSTESKDTPESDVKAMCFDTHYEISGMSIYWTMDRFLAGLIKKRTAIVDENYQQINLYLNQMYKHECEGAKPGHQLPLPLHDRRSALISPASPLEVARLIYLPKSYYQSPIPKICRRKHESLPRRIAEQAESCGLPTFQ